ncbi:MAG: hypothetical protein IKJ25_02305 [Clostridia bacterium]|nr:hypothetical protein [Clostridia bacterium]
MKKTVSAILVCVLLVCSLLTLVSCGKSITGSFTGTTLNGDVTYKFEIGGKVTKTTNPILGKGETIEGEYKFNEDGNKITLTFNEEYNTYDYSEGEEDGVEYIKLDGWKYTKAE